MPKESTASKAIAATFIILTVCAVAGIVTMTIVYNIKLSGLDPTRRPPPTTTTPAPPPVMRLPRNLIPEDYRVIIQPYLYTQIPVVVNETSPNQTLSFRGNSTVNFHCVRTTKTIYLHSKDQKVFGGFVKNRHTNEFIPVVRYKRHEDESNFLEISLNKTLETGGNYSLFLAFFGEISENLEALFVSTYDEGTPDPDNDKKTERFLAVTNLEPTSARRVFPCFDEPDMKAVFHVSIIHRLNTKALANAQFRDSEILPDGWQITHFHPTPKMSTYLFAFTVSEFMKAAPSEHERVKIQTYARPEAIAAGHADYAARVTGKILSFYEHEFEINYQQPALDQIALPDLDVGAMENWGLITYQEGALLFENGVSSEMQKEHIVTIIAHELAHQWFGNLVTMKWWNDIWLNEGFATYMSFLAVDHVEPTFKIKELSIVLNLHAAFEEDSLVSSHPLSPPADEIQTTSDIIQMFDTITYCKGAVMLRMLEDVVGERVFSKGIKMYLSGMKFENAAQSDFWDYMQQAVDEDNGYTQVAKMMKPWTSQIGYPVLTINTTSGEIYQKHFLFNDSSHSDLWWEVPIRVMSKTSEPTSISLDTPDPEMKNELISKDGEWILANVNCTGYYRVNYNPENWDRLLSQMETNQSRIPLMNRVQLIDDAFNLARAKLVNVTLALNSTRFLRNETEYIPWDIAIRNMEYFVLMFDRSEVYGPMQAYLRERVTNLYNHFRNYTDNSTVPKDHTSQRNQINAIWFACSNGLQECVTMASDKYAEWMNHPNGTNNIHPNLRASIYCQAVAAGGKEEWEFAWKMYQTTTDTSEKDNLFAALACTKKIWLLTRYLEYTLDPEKIRLMDVASAITYVAKNVAGQALAWNFIRANWDYVSQDGASMLISGVTRRFSQKFELDELERFQVDFELGSARAVNQAIEQTRVNIEWVKEHKDIVLQWFERETSSET